MAKMMNDAFDGCGIMLALGENQNAQVISMYQSTRGETGVTAQEALIRGIAKDGGLYVPDNIKPIPFLTQGRDHNYRDVMRQVFSVFLADMGTTVIEDLVNKSYPDDRFGTPPVKITPIQSFDLLTLWHGPTFAFKDMALSVLPDLMNKAREALGINTKTIVLTATSGDTGGATLEGFDGDENTETIILYPNQKISPFQERQMCAYQSKKHHVIALKGSFDDCQRVAKKAFETIHPKRIRLTSANSINIGRIIPQIVYYVHAYLRLVDEQRITFNETIDIVVPSGNFGNMLAGYYAFRLGVPIGTFLVASNENDVLTTFFNTGRYDVRRPFHQTISPSMDILISSNLERLLYEASLGDHHMIKRMMAGLATEGWFEADPDMMARLSMFKGVSVSEEETKETIRKVFVEDRVLIDPHTAVGIKALSKAREASWIKHHPLVISTASPYKFSDVVLTSLGEEASDDPLENITRLEHLTHVLADARIKDVLKTYQEPIVLSVDETLQHIKKLVGERDV